MEGKGLNSGLMVAQFARCLRQLPVDPDTQINLLSNALTASGAPGPLLASLSVAAGFLAAIPTTS